MLSDDSPQLADELLDVQRTLGWMDLVISSIGDAVYVIDREGRLIFANQYFSDLLSVPRVFLLGKTIDAVFPLTKINPIPVEYSQTVSTLSAEAGELSGIYKWQSKNGSMRIFRVSCRRLATTGQTVYLAQDITHEYELANTKANFIDMASHQLRTPMTAVMAYSHMLKDGYAGALTKPQEKLSDTIITSSERMIRLVNDLLKITSLQNDNGKLDGSAVSLKDLFEQIDTEVAPRVKQKNIDYTLYLSQPEIVIDSDEAMLQEVFSNLIDNAIQYTPDGGKIQVNIAARKNSGVEVSISDTGIGIPKEYHPQLFDQFSRADNALIAHPEGTGLGLYVIKIVLEKIGGNISFKSKVNAGTTFVVKLPPLKSAA